ncbi:MAG: FAD binding domain-containing protein [Acidimicrobiales bacterium]
MHDVTYLRPKNLQDAVQLFRTTPECRPLAGGTDLMVMLHAGTVRPAPRVVLDVWSLPELKGVRRADGMLEIGAAESFTGIIGSAEVHAQLPALAAVARTIGAAQIQNRGTLGGNLAHADPASELPALMLALDARFRAQSARGERWIEAREFFRGVFTTALRADELLAEVELPELRPRTGTCFMEVARRRGDYAMMGVAAVVALGADDRCTHARLAYCNAGETPVSAATAAQALVGSRIGEGQIHDVAVAAQREIDPLGNVHASKAFQRHLAGVLTRRALQTAVDRAKAGR